MDENSSLVESAENLTCDTYIPKFTEHIKSKFNIL